MRLSVKYDLKKLEYLKNYKEVALRVKTILQKHDSKAELYIFGSVLEGKMTALSDIDLLVVSARPEIEYRLKLDAYQASDAPLEIHFATPDQYKNWYRRFIKKKIKV